MSKSIRIVGARQHNLKNLTLEIPRDQLVVVTGVSGSGKTSLAFDTLYAEGQRRYVESLSAQAQMSLERMEKPDVDFIDGLSPAIAIEQLSAQANPRSTVATATEIYDYLRVLYATCGQPHDPATGEPVTRHTTVSIVDTVLGYGEGARLMICAPLPESEIMQGKKLWEKLGRQGFVRVRINGVVCDLEEKPEMPTGAVVELVIDRLVVKADVHSRLMDSIGIALRWSGSASTVLILRQTEAGWAEERFTTLFLNPVTGFRMPPLTPKHFSFNSHHGACPHCQGLGAEMHCDPDLLVPDAEKSIADGAIKTWWSKNPKLKAVQDRQIMGLVAHFAVSDKIPFSQTPAEFRHALFNGTGKTAVKLDAKVNATTRTTAKPFEGLLPQAARLLEDSESEFMKLNIRRYMNSTPCTKCLGQRLKPEILAVTMTVGPPDDSAEKFIAEAGPCSLLETPEQQAVADHFLQHTAQHLEATIDEYIRRYGQIADTDLARELCPAYAASRESRQEHSRGTSHTANALARRVYQRLLETTALGFVIFNAGGPGSGKSSSLTSWDRDNASIIYDTVMGDAKRGISQIESALSKGHVVKVNYVHQPLLAAVRSMINRSVSPDNGRIVEAYSAAIRHFGAQKAIFEVADHFAGNPLVTIEVIDNQHFQARRITLSELKKHRYKEPLETYIQQAITEAETYFYEHSSNPAFTETVRRRILRPFLRRATPPDAGARPASESGRGRRPTAAQRPTSVEAGANSAVGAGTPGPATETVATTAAGPHGASTGNQRLNIIQFTQLPITAAREALRSLQLTPQQRQIAADVLRELNERLGFLINVGLGYLTLDRPNGTLSGGEAQRTRLAKQLGSRLSGVLYVLDEPSIGLHQRDNDQLIATLRELTDKGNSLIVVEHDEDTIRAADYVLDLGPGAGLQGGHILAAGTPQEIEANPASITGRYLSGASKIAPASSRRTPQKDDLLGDGWLRVLGCTENTLKNIDAAFPLGCLTCVTGVSGSGKSTLVDDILRRELFRKLYHAKDTPGQHRSIQGLQQIDKAIVIDQSPIGRNPRSNPATFVGAFTAIREIYAQLPASKTRGFTPGTFSFNTTGGRCEVCQGDGQLQIDMHFLSDVYVHCDACEGKRYNRDVLEVLFKGKSIADVLEMSLEESADFFRSIPGLGDKLRMLVQVGLGYLKLGQAANTLSGGEAQRIKLAAELGKRSTGKTLYLLDEPTTGLHFADIDTLLKVLFNLRDQGNTLIVIEHNLDLIKCADWIIDLGPEGGELGGEIVAQGPPELVAKCDRSHTGRYLRAKLT